MNATNQSTSEQIGKASQLLEQSGVASRFELVPLSGGANSRAFRIDFKDDAKPLFFKEYFHHPDDARDRLGTEFAFASFAWEHGLRTLAQPLAMNRGAHGAIYSFLDGRKIEPHEITDDSIEQCLHFFEAINAYRTTTPASRLPTASEACFTLADHLQCLQRRVARFDGMAPTTLVDRQAQELIRAELSPACTRHVQAAQELAARLGIAADAPLAEADRCLSPSDFGFHNALMSRDGTLRFLDFEYAGWDDPAKLVCDFFCQPACPVPGRHYAEFSERIAATTLDPTRSRKRFDLLLPIYRLKWCCIMLNDFLPAGGSRRRFAVRGLDEVTRKRQQLRKARTAFECLKASSSELAA